MNNAAILLGLFPSAALIVLGGVCWRILPKDGWQAVDSLNYQVLFPALLFTASARGTISFSDALTIGPIVWAIMGAGLLVGFCCRRWGPGTFLDYAGCWQTTWRFNAALAIVTINAVPGANAALMSIAVGLAVPMANIFAIAALSRGTALSWTQGTLKILFNPFFVGSFGGFLWGLFSLPKPEVFFDPLNLIAQAALPIALLSVGATLNWRALGQLDAFSSAFTAIKLVVLPITAVVMIYAFGLRPDLALVLLVFAAVPTSSSAHVLAAGFGADRVKVATLIAQSTLLSAITLPLWLMAKPYILP